MRSWDFCSDCHLALRHFSAVTSASRALDSCANQGLPFSVVEGNNPWLVYIKSTKNIWPRLLSSPTIAVWEVTITVNFHARNSEPRLSRLQDNDIPTLAFICFFRERQWVNRGWVFQVIDPAVYSIKGVPKTPLLIQAHFFLRLCFHLLPLFV
jgi:hypothetical protein